MSKIVSSLPGRIRVRAKSWRDQGKLNALKKELSKIPAVTALRDNVRTGSILLHFDSREGELSAMEANINAVVDEIIGKPPTPQSILTKKNLNRYNKLAMLASLGSSLAFTAAHRRRWRRWHALTGYVFAANLAVHLFIYRKSLYRLFR